MDLYREEILEHWQNPQNFGVMPKADIVIEQVNPLCGDEVTFYFKLANQAHPRGVQGRSQAHPAGEKSYPGGVIRDVRFTGSGCAISMASASILSEAIKGKSISKLSEITGQDVLGLIGGPVAPARLKCAFLALEAVKKLTS